MPSRPPQPPMDRWFSSEQAMGLAASILIGLVTVMSWADRLVRLALLPGAEDVRGRPGNEPASSTRPT